MKDKVIARIVYLVLGTAAGIAMAAYKLNKDFAPGMSNNLALAYFRGCTLALANMDNKKKLTVKEYEDVYFVCVKATNTYHETLEKNL